MNKITTMGYSPVVTKTRTTISPFFVVCLFYCCSICIIIQHQQQQQLQRSSGTLGFVLVNADTAEVLSDTNQQLNDYNQYYQNVVKQLRGHNEDEEEENEKETTTTDDDGVTHQHEGSTRGDQRLFRWDVTDHTYGQQKVLCNETELHTAFRILQTYHTKTMITDPTTTTSTDSKIDYNLDVIHLLKNVLEYTTFCITDNRSNRAIFADFLDENNSPIHTSIVALIQLHIDPLHTFLLGTTQKEEEKEDQDKTNESEIRRQMIRMVAHACHVVYITTFANKVNHQLYINHNIVTILSHLLKKIVSIPKNADNIVEYDENEMYVPAPYLTMWICMAFANLAANYCRTQGNGRCYYDWDPNVDILTIESGSLPQLSDGTKVRQQLIHDTNLMNILLSLCCIGPVGMDEYDNVNVNEMLESHLLIGLNTMHEHDEHEQDIRIVPFAATSILKNVAIDPMSHSILEPHVACFCYHSKSIDWIEENKGSGVLHYLRRGNPCWFGQVHEESLPPPSVTDNNNNNNEEEGAVIGYTLCIDHKFYHMDKYTCSDYKEDVTPTEEECNVHDRYNSSIVAKDACCACGGGTIRTTDTPSGHRHRIPLHKSKINNNHDDEEDMEDDGDWADEL